MSRIHCCKGNEHCEWGSGNGHFSGGPVALEHFFKFRMIDYVGDLIPRANLEFNPVKGDVSAHQPICEVLAVRLDVYF